MKTGKFCPGIFLELGKIRQPKEMDGLCLSFAVSRHSGTLTPAAPIAIRLWDTLTF